MKLYKSILLGSVLIAQSAVVMAAPLRLGEITLEDALPELTKFKLPVLGGTGILDLPLIGGYFNSITQVGLNQYAATLTHAPQLLSTTQDFLPILTGAHGTLPGLSLFSALKNGAGSRGSGGIRQEVLNPKD